MKFGSWTFSADLLQLGYLKGLKMIDLNDYVYSGTWDLINCPSEIVTENSTDGEPPREYIIYTLYIRRKTLFYTINLVMPCVLLALLSIIVFYLPSDCGEKMTLAISLLLALVVFLLLVSMILPPTSLTIPLVAKYLLFTFLMNVCTIFITVIIINWNYRGPDTHTMPEWFKKLFVDFLPKYLLIQRPKTASVNYSGHRYSKLNTNPDIKYHQQTAVPLHLSLKESTHHPHCSMFPGDHQTTSNEAIAMETQTVDDLPQAQKTSCAVEFITDHMKVDDKVSEASITFTQMARDTA